MEIYLVRHTTPDIAKGICYGQSDINLTSGYKEEIAHTRSLLPSDLDEVFSSPLIRCQRLSNSIFKNPILDDRLMELNFGDWELKPWNSITMSDMNKWMDDYVNQAPPQGETFLDLHYRVIPFFEEVCSRNHSKFALVCHAGVIRAILAHILNIKLEDSFKIQLGYGSVTRIDLTHDNFQLAYSNRT